MPELTDEFAQKVGPFKTVDELKADIQDYIDSINTDYQSKVTTEHSFRGALKTLLTVIANDGVRKESEKILVINSY